MVFTCFYHQGVGFPVNFPIIQFYELWSYGDGGSLYQLSTRKRTSNQYPELIINICWLVVQ